MAMKIQMLILWAYTNVMWRINPEDQHLKFKSAMTSRDLAENNLLSKYLSISLHEDFTVST